MIRVNVDGLEKMLDGLNKIEGRAKELGGSHSIGLKELLTNDFLSRNTMYESFNSLIEQSPFTIKSQEDFKAIPDEKWDMYIKANTKYPSLKELLNDATAGYIKGKLFR